MCAVCARVAWSRKSLLGTSDDSIVHVGALTTSSADGAAIDSPVSANRTGTSGNDVLIGTADPDLIVGGEGDDYVDGGAGADTLHGGTGNDQIVGGSENDAVYGGDGTDVVNGQSGDDYVEGGAGADRIYGGAGNDQLVGGADNDAVYGEDDDDVVNGQDGDDYVDGGAGVDTVYGGAGRDQIVGGLGNDVLYGEADDDVVNGQDGDDYVDGGVGVDSVYGGAGRDQIVGGLGNDLLYGEADNDTVNGQDGDDYVDGGLGNDTVYGGIGADQIVGAAGDDSLYGEDGNDVVNGQDGNDYVDGGAGADSVYGGAGRDQIVGGLGSDSLFGEADDDTVNGQDGDDYVDGGSGADSVYGGTGRDQIVGGLGNDALFGEADDDIINGEDGNDTVDGGAGNDLVDGGAGQDWLVGGAGADIFRFLAASHSANGLADTISDFVSGLDRIDLSQIDANSATGTHDTFLFIGTNGFSGRAGELRYVQSGTLFDLYADLNGDGAADMHIRVNGTGLTAGDINGAVVGQAGNRSPVISSGATSSVAENSPTSTIIYQTSASDPDGDPISYRLSGADAGLFSIDPSGAVRLLSSANYEARNSYSFTVHAEDGRGGTAAQSVTLSITNVNEAPVITSGTSASIPENSPTSTVVYQTAASDPEGNPLTYSLSGADASFFTIDASGAVRFLQSPNFEARSSYSLTVQASDGSLSTSRVVAVTVTDVNENSSSTPIINETSAANDSIGAAQAISRSQLAVAPNGNLPDPSLPSIQINGNVSAPGDTDFFSITLQAGELLILDVDGTNALDAFLRVFGPTGSQIASNDDAIQFDPGSTAHSGVSHNLDSLVRFRAPTSGTYTFSIASFQDQSGTPTSSGIYTINVSVGPPASQAQIDQENVQSLISGSRWSGTSVSYGFTTSATQYPGSEGDPEKTIAFEALNPTQQAVSRTTFGLISQYTGVTFTENAGSPGSAQIRLAQSDEAETAHAYYPGPGDGGDVWFRNHASGSSTGDSRFENPVPGNYGYLTFLHEIGHAMGLKHGHESPALSPDRDSMEFSVMTYRGYIGAADSGGYRNETWGFAQTFMMYDIAALQQIYGPNFNTNSGDTRYSWDVNTGAFSINGAVQWTPGGNRVFQTIWDGGGTDTYDLSNYSGGVTIDLRPGEWSTTSSVQLANLGDGNRARGNIANALLHNGDTRSLIENAVGGSGNDALIAGQAANRLTGGGGIDTFVWKSIGDASATTGPDRILDFLTGSGEKIDLSGIDAITGTSGDDAFTFIGTNAFTGAAGQLRYAVDANGVNIYGDTNGDAVADLHIIVNGTTIVSQDFIF